MPNLSLREICKIGARYGQGAGRDLKMLAAAVRFVEARGMPSIEEFTEEIKRIPGCVDGWELWSLDKRWSPAWYFTIHPEKDLSQVGYYSAEKGDDLVRDFASSVEGCAYFIQKELEDFKHRTDPMEEVPGCAGSIR